MSDIQAATTTPGSGIDTLDQSSASTTELATFDPNTAGKGMDFVEKFSDPADLAALKGAAVTELPRLEADPNYLTAYGNDVLDRVVQSTRQLNVLTGKVALPDEDEAGLRNLAIQVKKSSQWDMTVSANVEKYRVMKKKLTELFGKNKAKAYFEAFQTDRLSLEKLLDRMRGDLTDRSMHRTLLANQVAEQFKLNRESLDRMKERAAILQYARQMAEAERAAMPANISNDDPRINDARKLEMFIRLISLKIEQYSDRWYVGVALGPVYYSQWEQGVSMAFRLKMMATMGMEKVESIISAYAMQMDLLNDSDTITSFDKMDNDLTQKLFGIVKTTAITVAQQTSTGGMTVETISSMANDVSGMITGVQQAYANAKVNQEMKVKAIGDGVAIIEKAQDLSGAQSSDRSQVASIVSTGNQIRAITGISNAA
ncbi:MAG TPA: hypothetical protein VIM31_01830 [Candidatus Microsaccharimonas sp.]|jgi:hypothetical protein